jgi:propionate CoA-transferase
MESSAWMFRHYRQCLSATVLGFLQVDSAGNVNVSKRADDIADYVGPGGFPSIVASARCVFFVGTWMAHAQWEINAGRLRLSRPGTPKFVAEVDEITFSGEQALLNGKRVFYITNIGVLELTAAGLVLSGVMPGVDIRRDVLDATKARILLPDGGAVPIIPECVVSGDGFALQWGGLRNN